MLVMRSCDPLKLFCIRLECNSATGSVVRPWVVHQAQIIGAYYVRLRNAASILDLNHNLQGGSKKLAITYILLKHQRYWNIINHLITSTCPLLHAFLRCTFAPKTPTSNSQNNLNVNIAGANSTKRASKIRGLHLPFLAHLWQYWGKHG